MLVSSHGLRLSFLNQSIMKVLLSCLDLCMFVLVELHLLVKLFSIDFSDVLHHHCDVFGVELALHT